jgi:hypothetical protein
MVVKWVVYYNSNIRLQLFIDSDNVSKRQDDATEFILSDLSYLYL